MAADNNINTKDKIEQAENKDVQALKASKRSFWQSINPGYIVAGFSTLATSFLSIGKNFHKNNEDTGVYSELDEARNRAHQKVRDAKSKKRIQDFADEFEPAIDKVASGEDPQAIEKIYAKLAHSIESGMGAKTPFDKWRRLKGHQQLQVGLTVLTVTSIALGAIYSFSRERRLADKLHQQIAQNADQSLSM